MSAKKSYNRFFIIFQEEDKGYGIGPDRPPTGYVKVETKGDKGKVTVYAQNLKPFEDGECLYKCYLISHQDKKDDVVYLGIMNIDELGRGESSWESGAENAFESKVSVEKFNAAAIVVESKGIDRLVAPLAGYMSKEKFEWRSKMPVKHQKQEAEVYVEAPVQQVSEEAKKFEVYERQVEEIASKVEAQKALETAKTDEIEPEDVRKPDEVIEEKTEEDLERKHKQKDKSHPCSEHGGKGPSHYDPRTMLKKFLEDILEDCEELDMSKRIKDCRMWKIDMKKYSKDMHKVYKFPCYDLVFYLMMNNPYCNYNNYIKKHGHYLFGIQYEKDDDRQGRRSVRRLVFGIPGVNAPADQPFQGVTGFITWTPSKDNSSEGYWLMAYDPMTGLVTSLDD